MPCRQLHLVTQHHPLYTLEWLTLTSCLLAPDPPEVEVVMVTAGADDLDMEAAPLDPLGLGDTRLGRGQALPQQIKPRKSLLIVVVADKFAEDNNSPSPAILEIRSLNIPPSSN